jgi:chemotaxis protein methyltransferase WspC
MRAHELLRRETGLDLAPADTRRAVARRMAARGYTRENEYLAALTDEELAALIDLVVVPESWLFRDAEAFAAAAAATKERLASEPARPQRLLSLPCAGGEEPYSLAIALHEAGLAEQSWHIDAVDLSAAAIARARTGRFSRNAFRGNELGFRERHFHRFGEEYEIDAALRTRVHFGQGNLFTYEAPGRAPYDIVFCRNLLIYFDAAGCTAAASRLAALLRDDGLLFAGYAEVPVFLQYGFEAAGMPGAFAVRKRHSVLPGAARKGAAGATPVAPPRPAPAPATAARPATAPSIPPTAAQLLREARRAADHGEHAAASDACQVALALDPACADAYFILGLVASSEAAAMAHWRRCIYLEPQHYEALCHLALAAEHEGDTAQAQTLRQRAARVHQRRAAHGSLS